LILYKELWSKELCDARDLLDYGVDIKCDLINNGKSEDTPWSEIVGTIQGIEFYRDTAPICAMELEQVAIDGFDFWYISAGCDYTLNSIGYVAYISNEVYSLEEVMLSGRVTVEDIHDLYMIDEDRREISN